MALLPSTSTAAAPSRQARWPVAVPAGNLLLVATWLWLSFPTLHWLADRGADPGARTNSILFLGALLALAIRSRAHLDLRAALRAQPEARLGPLVLFLSCAVCQFLKVHLLGSNLIASMAFLAGCHGLAGLYLAPHTWRRGWALLLFSMALLPFGPHIDAFLGFPVRIASARVAREALLVVGIKVQSVEAILILENGVANIDLLCSGAKGLWVGGIFFLALTWIERRNLGLVWFAVGVVFASSLVLANLLRVLCLVLIGCVAGQPSLAALVHLPLGVFGFAASCALAILLVRRLPADDRPRSKTARSGLGYGAFIIAGVLGMLALTRSADRVPAELQVADVHLPADWLAKPVLLEARERLLFESNGGHRVGKWRFRAGESRGEVLVAVADSFRSHHAAEVCLAAAGHRIDGIRREFIDAAAPFKLIDLDHHQASAAAWFQSATQTTDSLIDRTLAEFLRGDRRWALVSVLFDQPANSDRPTLALLRRLHAAVAVSLANDSQKGP